MSFHLESAHLVAMVAIALAIALLLAVKFRPATWRGVICKAVIANVSAIAVALAFELLITRSARTLSQRNFKLVEPNWLNF